MDAVSAKAIRPNVPVVSILSSRAVRAELRDVTDNRQFEDLPTPLGIVAVDIEAGEEVLLRRGRVWPALVASMAYPVVYEPVRLGGRLLVDGGVLNPVPVSACVALGADFVVSCNLSASMAERLASRSRNGESRRRRLLIDSLGRTLEVMQAKIVEESNTRADVVIRPVFSSPVGLLEFKRAREIEAAGEAAVEQACADLKQALPWLQ
jgi:NTE family protein